MKTTMTLAAALACLAASAQDDADPKKRDAVNKLAAMRISVDFKEIPLSDAMDFLRDASGINFHVDPKATEKDEKITLKVKDLPLKSVIKLMLTPRDLTGVYRDGVIVILPKADVAAATTTQTYDVRDLLMKIGDFPGPKVELVSPGTGPLTGITITMDEPKDPPITEDLLTDLVKSNTGGTTWDDGNASITIANGMLFVAQNKSVHREVADLLNKLRQYR